MTPLISRLKEATLNDVSCSQCGREFKSEKTTGFSHCKDHQKMLRDRDKKRKGELKEVRYNPSQVGALIVFNEGVDLQRVERWVASLGENVAHSTVRGFDPSCETPVWYCP